MVEEALEDGTITGRVLPKLYERCAIIVQYSTQRVIYCNPEGYETLWVVQYCTLWVI